MKVAMIKPLVLALLDFSQPFYIECDASERAVGVVLLQQGHLIACFSQALEGRASNMSTYEKELLALVSVVERWRPYLLRGKFTIKTNH